MSRWWVLLLWVGLAMAQQGPPPEETPTTAPKVAPPPDEQLPPEEDKAKIQKTYTFNPLQSKKEVTVGEFYFKKGDYKAAAGRFTEATKWNDGNAEAWLRLGDAQDKMHDAKRTRAAWQKYLELAADAKNAGEVRKKLEKLKTD